MSLTMQLMTDMLTLSAHLPEIEVDGGDVIMHDGEAGKGIWVLVSGKLEVRKDGVLVNTITEPGAIIGEVSVLLGTGHSATVAATEPTRLRFAADGDVLLASDPAITRLVAIGLAERLSFVTTYLADLKHQYADVPGLSMVSDVLTSLNQRRAPLAVPGSLRDPDPQY